MGCVNSKNENFLMHQQHTVKSHELANTKALSSPTSTQKEDKIVLVFKSKRANVYNKGIDLSDRNAFSLKNIPKSEKRQQLIKAALADNFIFSSLDPFDVQILTNSMEIEEFKAGDTIITQGQDGDFFYIIENGTFNVSVNGSVVSKLGGDGSSASFGDLALLHNTPRAATVRATSAATLFSLDRDTFRYTIAQSQNSRTQSIEKSLSSVPLLSELNPNQLSRISETVELVPFKAGDQIIVKGSVGNVFYMIKEGIVNVSELGINMANHTLTAGEYFGERALITGEPRAANIYAATDCVLLALDRDSFQDLLGPIQELLAHNMTLRTLMTCSLFEKLTNQEKSKAAKYFNFEKFPANTSIITQGENGVKFYIIKDGDCKVMADNKEVGKLTKGSYFGEMALLDDEVRKATVITINECEVFTIDRVTFTKIMGPLKELLLREKNNRMEVLNGVVNDSVDAQLNLKFKDLTALAVLGSGTFGKVTLVQECNTKAVYALKAMLKSEIVAHKQQTNVMNEKNVMLSCNNPFVLRLYQTFKDKSKIYMLLEFIQGGELFTVLHTPTNDGVPEPQAKFYAAGVLIGLAYMHSKKIAYRDMKPENCLIDNLGYPKIVDFGFAKVINTKSYTLCGTPEYLAPELVLGKGHNLAVDYWAFGILVFEMIAGYSPFSDAQGCDQVVICRNIVSGRLSFPRNFNVDCKEMIKRLLSRELSTRLGNLKDGTDDIFQHKWFNGYDFDLYTKKKIVAPWIPKVGSLTDTSNFDPYDTDDHVDNGYVDKENWDKDF